MNKTITLTVAGQPRELTADYLNPAALEYWRAWLGHEARMHHNPFEEFAQKVAALPEDLRAVATREFTAHLDFDTAPTLVLLETVRSLPAVKTLCILVTGEDVVTEENAAAAFPLLAPFVQRQEYVAGSLEEANAIRARLGKPPLGKPPLGKSAAGQPAGGQSPQGG